MIRYVVYLHCSVSRWHEIIGSLSVCRGDLEPHTSKNPERSGFRIESMINKPCKYVLPKRPRKSPDPHVPAEDTITRKWYIQPKCM